MADAYKKAGVDIDLAGRIIEKAKPLIHATNIPGVISEIGHFAGLFSLSQEKIADPVLISSTDGVGTKLMIASLMDKHDTIGIDLVAMCVNDILTCGAKPIFFLDYLATGKLEEKKMFDILKGITDGCKLAGCALLGGETAEMPGFYQMGDYDLAGFAVGIADREKIITGKNIQPGDLLIGLASSGLHSNGFSLVRKVLLGQGESRLKKVIKALGCQLGEELLRPTKIYVPSILHALKTCQIKGMAHITGGGFFENIPRMIPQDVSVHIYTDRWPPLPVLKIIQDEGEINDQDMFRIFNMGIGMVIVTGSDQYLSVLQDLKQSGETAYVIGEVVLRENHRMKLFYG